ncbi:MAG: LON peptidase substrate-binding domain-containing protein [Nitrospinales bacterium]
MDNLDDRISIFPLPTTVFYPSTTLPLHIFEPRYRQMIADALIGNRLIGMVLLKPDWEADYFVAPKVAPIGCVGKIDKAVQLPEGKYNILLEGLSRFKILEEIPGKAYRRAHVEFLRDTNDHPMDEPNSSKVQWLISHYEKYLDLLPNPPELPSVADLKDQPNLSHAVDQLIYALNPSVEEKQALLEELDVHKRVDGLLAMLDLKIQIVHLSKQRKNLGHDARTN